MRIDVDGLSWGVPGRMIVREIHLTAASGQVVGLIGPNGCGKSSLLRCIAGLRWPARGTVRYDGHDIAGWGSRRIARRVAFVEQTVDTESDLRVRDVVALGRTPFRAGWRPPSAADHAVVEAACEQMDLSSLHERTWRTLSGGERQRAHIARALAQRPSAILLDEPTNHLDIRHQLDLLQLLAAAGHTVVIALHDLSMAARFCDHLVLLDAGRVVASGDPPDVLDAGRLREVFAITAEIEYNRFGHLTVSYR